MEGKTFAKYLSSADATNSVVEDVYFNDVILLISGSKDDNSRGLPFSRDYSRYQHQVKNITGSDIESSITYPETTDLIGVTSYMKFPNKLNRVLRAAEQNLGQSVSSVLPTYADVQISGSEEGFSLGNGDFTIEFSFFFDEIYPLQTIFCVGGCLSWDGVNSPSIDSSKNGYGVFIENTDLVFFANGKYKINSSSLLKNTFYSVCIQRKSGKLQTYTNFEQTNEYNLSKSFNYLPNNNQDTKNIRLYIGAFLSVQNNIQSSFSGGISNFRITKNVSRYKYSFYGYSLPFFKPEVENKIDDFYEDVIFNFPFQYDCYDYSKNNLRFENSQLRNITPNFNTGFIELDGDTIYTSENCPDNLSNSNWTIEFYLGLYSNRVPVKTEKSLSEWLSGNPANTEDIEQVNLIKLTSNSKNVLSIDFNYFSDGNENYYYSRSANFLSFSLSENGNSYKDFESESNNFIVAAPLNVRPPKQIPNNRIIFYYNSGISANISQSSVKIAPQDSEPNTHFCISRSGNYIYFYVNGVNVKTIEYNGNLYQKNNFLKLSFGSFYSPWLSYSDSKICTLGIKGVRVTNVSRYLSTLIPNLFSYYHCLQPLSLNFDVLNQPKARIIGIKPVNTSLSISSSTCQWYVYFSQPVDNLSISDFALSQLEGVSGASLLSIQKNNELEYLVTANTGTGNGKIGLNFNDRKTVKYKGINKLISNYLGELNYFGDEYKINKNSPAPILSSGTSPYINETFTCTLVWDSAIVSFDFSKIGVSNGVISNIILINDVSQTYQFNVTPERQGVVYVQVDGGAAVTDGGILSSKSNLLARIYSDSFPILQLPLNLSTTFLDVSPNQYTLNEIVPNNTLFSTTAFPLGESSCLSVIPQLEQSGLEYLNFEAIGQSSSLVMSGDWTIEFNLRCNTYSPQNTTHILSVEKASTGFAILAVNGNIQICRSMDIPSNLFSVSIQETDIFSGNTPIYPAFSNNSYTQQQKFPHFAITKKGNVYRFYRNGIRVGLTQSNEILNISSGDLKVGYYRNRVTQAPYLLSNLRLTVGKALYTSYQHDIPLLPYQTVTNILDVSELLDYISITSNNPTSNKAINGNTIKVDFNSIVKLNNSPTVNILGKSADVVNTIYNSYSASILVEEELDQKVSFEIIIEGEPSLPSKTFSSTTNGSSVFIENSPFTVNLKTDELNNGSYKIYVKAELNKDCDSFSLSSLSLSNCIVGGLLKSSNSNTYTFEVQALTSGDFSLSIPENSLTSSIGTYNEASNILTRSAVVPDYIPDPYFANTLLLIQPTSENIFDESFYECELSVNNVSVVSDNYPTGLLKSMRFNGQGSSIVATLNQPISSSQDYCIEFFIYLDSLTTFSLSAPKASPASSITSTSFDLSWSQVDNANNYVLDISLTPDFSKKLDGYNNKVVGNITNLSVSSDASIESPEIKDNRVKSSLGFVSEWKKVSGAIGYKVYTSLSESFATTVKSLSNIFTRANNISLGNLKDCKEYISNNINQNTDENISGSYSSTSILQGILSSGSSSPKIFAFNDENSLRVYKSQPNYSTPAIAEDIESKKWFHIAFVNQNKYAKLYVDGELKDKLKNEDLNWSNTLNIGYAITNFNGYITSFRVTYGVARYTTDFEKPDLPLSKN